MFEAIVTFVTEDEDATVPGFKNIITKVYRLEFEAEEDFQNWLHKSGPHTISREQLKSA